MYLQLKDVKKSYGESGNITEVLKGISFELERGKICVLLGPSGSGKYAAEYHRWDRDPGQRQRGYWQRNHGLYK